MSSRLKALEKRLIKFSSKLILFTASAKASVHVMKLNPQVMGVFLCVTIAHEAGHYVAAKKHTQAELPWIIQAGPIALGATKVKNFSTLNSEQRTSIIKAGPISGSIAALIISLVLPQFRMLSLMIAVKELSGLYIGSDGRKLKHIRQKEIQI